LLSVVVKTHLYPRTAGRAPGHAGIAEVPSMIVPPGSKGFFLGFVIMLMRCDLSRARDW